MDLTNEQWGLIAVLLPKPRVRRDGRKRRWKVERLFAWLKNFRRLVARSERKESNFLGFLYFGCIVILLRRLR